MRFLKLATLVVAMVGGALGLARGPASATPLAASAMPAAQSGNGALVEKTQFYYGGPRYYRAPRRVYYGGGYRRPVIYRRPTYYARPVYYRRPVVVTRRVYRPRRVYARPVYYGRPYYRQRAFYGRPVYYRRSFY